MNLANISFEGKTGIITGGANGIGYAISEQFAAMGGKAVIVDVNREAAEAACAKLENATYYCVDLGDEDAVVEVFNKIVSDMDRVDILINNAGIVNTRPFDELPFDEWKKIIRIDLNAVFLTCQILFKHMAEKGGGRIVNVASVAGKVGGGYLGTSAYAAAKAGVISLTKSIAKDGSKHNIYCNSLCPAYTKTPLTSIMTEEKANAIVNSMALGRAAAPEEVASAILFLASDAASFVQGENLNCDGGLLMNG